MQCQEIKEWMISALYEEELSPEAQRQLEAHLAACAACRQEMSAMAATRQTLAQWEVDMPTGALVDTAAIPVAGWPARFKQFFNTWLLPAGRLGYRMAMALMVFLGFLAILNSEVTWEGAKLSFHARLWAPGGTSPESTKKPNNTGGVTPVNEPGAGNRRLSDEELMQWVESRLMESERSTVLRTEDQIGELGLETHRKFVALQHKFSQIDKPARERMNAPDRPRNLDKN